MTFNKWFPHRTETPSRRLGPTGRAVLLRGMWYVSTLMMIVGYVLLFLFWNGSPIAP